VCLTSFIKGTTTSCILDLALGGRAPSLCCNRSMSALTGSTLHSAPVYLFGAASSALQGLSSGGEFGCSRCFTSCPDRRFLTVYSQLGQVSTCLYRESEGSHELPDAVQQHATVCRSPSGHSANKRLSVATARGSDAWARSAPSRQGVYFICSDYTSCAAHKPQSKYDLLFAIQSTLRQYCDCVTSHWHLTTIYTKGLCLGLDTAHIDANCCTCTQCPCVALYQKVGRMSDAVLCGEGSSRRGACVVAAKSEAGAWQSVACMKHVSHSKVSFQNSTHTASDHLSITCLARYHGASVTNMHVYKTYVFLFCL